MTAEIRVPVLGESVSSAVIARWLKQPGESVSADEAVAELETDKVSVEVASPVTGTLASHAVPEGTEVEIGALLATVMPGKAQADTPPAPNPAETPKMSPPPMPAAARHIAQHGLDAAHLAGSGRDGRITKGDVLAALPPQPTAPAPAPAPVSPSSTAPKPQPASPQPPGPAPHAGLSGQSDPRETRVRMTRLRQTIARRLKEAQSTAAILTTVNEIDMSAARAMRAEYREAFEKAHGVRLGFMSFFARACAVALKEFPAINAEIDGEDIVYREFVNLGIAISSPRGLVVPVLRDADTMGFAEIERRIAECGKRARDGALSLDELTGGTFSITNGGVFGSLLSTPILNAPQSGILGMHAIQDRPVAIKGEVVIRPMMYVALSYDHRIVDGREAVSFLVRVKQLVEDPRRLILGL